MKESCFKSCFCSKEGNGVNKVVMLNSFQHLHRLKSASKEEIPDQARDDNRRLGFTLIELLVVVLIIGILAAVAVPQYQKAVRKARIAEARVILKALVDASDVSILQRGNYDNIMTSLDIEVPTQTKNWTFVLDECAPNSQGKVGCAFYAEPRFETGYSIYYSSSNYDDEWANKWLCGPDDEAGQKICQPLGKDMELEDYEFGIYEMTL